MKNIYKILDFVQEIGTIMYAGGLLSHIVIGVLFVDAETPILLLMSTPTKSKVLTC